MDDILSRQFIKFTNVVKSSYASVVLFESSFTKCTGFLCWFAPNSLHDQAFTLILPRHIIPPSSSLDTELEKYNIKFNDSIIGIRAVKRELFQRTWSEGKLDIIVLHLYDKVTLEWFRLGAKFLEVEDVVIGTTVIAMGPMAHPLGMDIHTSMGQIKQINNELVIHTAGTAPGFSGCPLLNQDQCVVAVHLGQYSNNEKKAVCLKEIEQKFFEINSDTPSLLIDSHNGISPQVQRGMDTTSDIPDSWTNFDQFKLKFAQDTSYEISSDSKQAKLTNPNYGKHRLLCEEALPDNRKVWFAMQIKRTTESRISIGIAIKTPNMTRINGERYWRFDCRYSVINCCENRRNASSDFYHPTPKLKPNDIVAVLFDPQACEIGFAVNGKLKDGYIKIELKEDENVSMLYPACDIVVENDIIIIL